MTCLHLPGRRVALTRRRAGVTVMLTWRGVDSQWCLDPVTPAPSPRAALRSRAEADPSRSQACVRCLVPSCRRPGTHPGPGDSDIKLR